MSEDHVTVYASDNVRDADLLKMRLDRAGLDAVVVQGGGNEPSAAWQVQVPKANAKAAGPIVKELRAKNPGITLPEQVPPEQVPPEQAPPELEPLDVDEEIGLTEIYSAASLQQAHLLKGFLEQIGIRCVLSNATLAGGSAADFFSEPGAAKVKVMERDVATARRYALEFDRTLTAVSSVDELMNGEDLSEEELEDLWPRCPECDRRRATACPICHTTGTDLAPTDFDVIDMHDAEEPVEPRSCGCGSGGCSPKAKSESVEEVPAELPEHEEHGPRMWMCSVCDEPFVPAYPNRCEWCGHHFEDGYEVPEIAEPGEQITGRAIVVMLLLGAVVLIGCALFLSIA